MSKGFWRGKAESGESQPFDAAKVNWVSVTASEFFFEPYCTDFKPSSPGNLVILFGDEDARDRGVEVDMDRNGVATVWVPMDGRAFWCPSAGDDEHDEPWEKRLQEFDTQIGELVGD